MILPKIHLAASGEGSRIRDDLTTMEVNVASKHLLPIRKGDISLLMRNILHAKNSGLEVVVHTNRQNNTPIQEHIGSLACTVVVDPDTRPLGPFTFTDGNATDVTALSMAGDLYIEDFDWRGFLADHKRSNVPINLLVARRPVPARSATFSVDGDNRIVEFTRVQQDQPSALRNIGVYAFTMTPDVEEVVKEYSDVQEHGIEDQFMHRLVTLGLVGVREHAGVFYNINDLTSYQSLLEHTQRT